MSMESDTCATRPTPESLEGKEGKRLKSEPEPELEPEPESEPRHFRLWETKPHNELELSDFSELDNDPQPFVFACRRFVYRNKARIKLDEEIEVAMAEYRERSRGLSVFDAIAPPEIAGLVGGVRPVPMTDELRNNLIPLCKLALETYNSENQGANFEFHDVLKTTYSSGGKYNMTFEARDLNNHNSNVTIFQARVMKQDPPYTVFSCAIKT